MTTVIGKRDDNHDCILSL